MYAGNMSMENWAPRTAFIIPSASELLSVCVIVRQFVPQNLNGALITTRVCSCQTRSIIVSSASHHYSSVTLAHAAGMSVVCTINTRLLPASHAPHACRQNAGACVTRQHATPEMTSPQHVARTFCLHTAYTPEQAECAHARVRLCAKTRNTHARGDTLSPHTRASECAHARPVCTCTNLRTHTHACTFCVPHRNATCSSRTHESPPAIRMHGCRSARSLANFARACT